MKTAHLLQLLALSAALVIIGALLLVRPAYGQDAQYGSNWQAFYWTNTNPAAGNYFPGNPTVSRTDPAINFNWQTGSPDPAISADHFSARWYNTINFAAGTYRFQAGADDGIRVTVDGNFIINQWHDATAGFQIYTADVVLGAGNHQIIVDYYENVGNAGVLFRWTTIAGGGAVTPIGTQATVGPAPTATVLSPETLPLSKVRAVVIVELANVRSGPGTTFTPVAEVKRNDDFRVIANNGANTWFLIETPSGVRGWIFRRMIYLYNGDWTKLPVLTVPVSPEGPLVDVQGEAAFPVVVRDAPSVRNSTKIGALNQGQVFKILKLSRNRAWVFIDADGLQGWVYLPMVKVTFGNLGRLPVGN